MSETRGSASPRPWFENANPWPWFGRFRQKDNIGVGNPQNALTPLSARLGFSIDVLAGLASNASGSVAGGNYASTENAVLNLSSAQIASAPAFGKRAQYD
jgi:hypothetical protein